ncbi:GNAT family N-acetyltransferase [Pseudoclavibacter sp. VKM Ac-2867]|uniref:GNAT family N-acetyltransferase n=1 Tax=Pseudoclavibacter sp. VKM Ac-2867 TaxID=2783829 RepID=UPI0019FAD04A|nr:GNAT family N-acetyltransferase [Pseudoclavibacter sp. VKM Ac-2867]MBF4459441.1 GNAT family N-acetyltransferase [Pseudoclavibacter sp. VKM Ac-2867]
MSGLDEFWSVEAIGSAIQAGDVDVAESADGIVGMAHVEELGGDLVLWKLYVLPGQQRHGLGRMLVRAAKDRARVQGKNLLTEYESSNERVRGFYLGEGFSAAAAPWPGTDAVWLRWACVAEQASDSPP